MRCARSGWKQCRMNKRWQCRRRFVLTSTWNVQHWHKETWRACLTRPLGGVALSNSYRGRKVLNVIRAVLNPRPIGKPKKERGTKCVILWSLRNSCSYTNKVPAPRSRSWLLKSSGAFKANRTQNDFMALEAREGLVDIDDRPFATTSPQGLDLLARPNKLWIVWDKLTISERRHEFGIRPGCKNLILRTWSIAHLILLWVH